jgi:hypothetical protein
MYLKFNIFFQIMSIVLIKMLFETLNVVLAKMLYKLLKSNFYIDARKFFKCCFSSFFGKKVDHKFLNEKKNSNLGYLRTDPNPPQPRPRPASIA